MYPDLPSTYATPPEAPAAAHAAPKPKNHLQLALIIGVAIMAVLLVAAGAKIVLDSQEATRLNASISTLESDNTDLETDLSDTQTDLRSAESENSILEDEVDQASTTIASYLVCTKGLLKSASALADGGLIGSYTALAAIKSVKGDCAYALRHSEIAKSEFA